MCCVATSCFRSPRSRILTARAQEIYLEQQLQLGTTGTLAIDSLASEVALMLQEHTQMGGVRPFGVTMLLAGVNAPQHAARPPHGRLAVRSVVEAAIEVQRQSGACLVKLDASGRYSTWRAAAIGKGGLQAEAELARGYRDGMSRADACDLLLSVIHRCNGAGTVAYDVQIGFVEETAICLDLSGERAVH